MAKKTKKELKRRKIENDTDRIVTQSTRVLQIIALIGAIAIVILAGNSQTFQVNPYVVPILLGIAVGLNPEQFKEIIIEIVKAFIGKGKK